MPQTCKLPAISWEAGCVARLPANSRVSLVARGGDFAKRVVGSLLCVRGEM